MDPNAVDTYDSGDDWEIGVGNLIIDLDADLEKDRQKFEMNNSTSTTSSSSTSSKDCGALASSGANTTSALADGLKFASVQPSAPQGNSSHKETSKSKVKRSKTSKDANKSLPSAALYGIPEISSAGKRQEVQGRPGEATGMNSALGQSASGNPNGNNNSTSSTTAIASCGKNKEEKPCKNQGSRGAKRDKDAGKSRKDKQHDLQLGPPSGPGGGGGGQGPPGHLYGYGSKGGGGSGSPFHCTAAAAAGEVSKGAPDSGLMGNSILVKKEEEEEESHRRVKKLKTEKVGQNPSPLHPLVCGGLLRVTPLSSPPPPTARCPAARPAPGGTRPPRTPRSARHAAPVSGCGCARAVPQRRREASAGTRAPSVGARGADGTACAARRAPTCGACGGGRGLRASRGRGVGGGEGRGARSSAIPAGRTAGVPSGDMQEGRRAEACAFLPRVGVAEGASPTNARRRALGEGGRGAGILPCPRIEGTGPRLPAGCPRHRQGERCRVARSALLVPRRLLVLLPEQRRWENALTERPAGVGRAEVSGKKPPFLRARLCCSLVSEVLKVL